MTDKYIPPVTILGMEDPSERYCKIEIGYTHRGLRIGMYNDRGYHAIDLPPDYAGLIAQALGLAVQHLNEAKESEQ